MAASEHWTVKAARGKKILEDSIPRQWLLPNPPVVERLNVLDVPKESMPAEQYEITELSAGALVKRMAAGGLKAEVVTTAFLKRATIGQQLINFATEFMWEEALEQAKGLDRYFEEYGKIKGPLHGVPVSVKEMVSFKGRTHNAAVVEWVDHIAADDAHIVKILRDAGAVFHVRTNQPQTVMHLDSGNNITGLTVNPSNRNLSAGGSSGGEGASIGFKCAPIGVAADIGGSIRCPAAFNGVYGFKPSALRTTLIGMTAPKVGNDAITTALGPIASCIDDLELFLQVASDAKPWDYNAMMIPLPWVMKPLPENYTIAVMMDDGNVHPHPPMTRALNFAKEKLQKAGINIVGWEPYKWKEIGDLVHSLYFPDGAACEREVIEASGEPVLPLTEWSFSWAKELTLRELFAKALQRDKFRIEHQAVMNMRNVDFILCPSAPGTAPLAGDVHYWFYTSVWNLLDMPGAIFPSGLRVDQELDKVEVDYTPRNTDDAREYEKYAPERFVDAPVSLQLVGKRYHDEAVLAAARVVDDVLQDAHLGREPRIGEVRNQDGVPMKISGKL
ncbi:hypothetical protein LTR84_008264 [Exophiala bonariae]|uniref:amidase n=1 Tax=Exophiala bonariae TaxID=1690606 RepID=A0AAV9N0X1_9EURO|nr:hypothetical protein LTR84_008264 [Exophiala bonariae]